VDALFSGDDHRRSFCRDETGRVFRLVVLLLDFIRQAGVGDGGLIRLQPAPNKLALDAKSCEIRSRWNVVNQICLPRFLPEDLPERAGLLLLSAVIFSVSHETVQHGGIEIVIEPVLATS
jgi:hypothetical protein